MRWFVLLFTPLLLLASANIRAEKLGPVTIELSSKCPKGFELVRGKRCELRSLYQFYTSTQNKGVGGTQTSLPAFRDGFSPQQIDLGRYLFFDPLLSNDKSLACASCHHPDKAFTDGKPVSMGSEGRLTKRSAPSLWNLAFQNRFFWDARVTSLEEQATGPLYADHEMANTPRNLISSLNNQPNYLRLFKAAFPEQEDVSLDQVYTALTAFQTSLVSLNSRYDQYAHGNHSALNEEEIKGMNVFRSFVARCAECHTPPMFTNNQVAVIGTPEPDGNEFDVGAMTTFNSEKMRGAFKVPTLRNIALTAPYMHSGRFESLREAAEFYTKGRGHAIPEGMDLHIHWHIWEPELQDNELDLLAAFLGALTDQTFMPAIPRVLPSGLTPVGSNGTLLTHKPPKRMSAAH